MKKFLKAFGVVALTGAMAVPALAGDDTSKDQKDLKKVIEDQGINYVETAQKGITLSGYVDTSYTYQFAGAGEYASAAPGQAIGNISTQNPGTTGPANTHAALRQFDTSNNTFNINAVKIALEKALPDKNEWAAGFRIDTIYGEDAKYLGDTALNDSLGLGALNNSGLALEQALVKFRVPVGNGLDFYVGKFVTFLGYEVIESPANLNFSRGLLFTNAIPLTHTGAYVDYKFNDTVEAKLGIVDGWNNSTSGSVGSPVSITTPGGTNDSSSFGKAITGQLNINAPGKNANISQSFIYSPEGEPGVIGADNGPVVVYDIWGNWSPTFVKDSKLLLGFNVDLGYNGSSGNPAFPTVTVPGLVGTGGAPVYDSNTWYGLALYSQYKFTKIFSLAGRLEYLHEDAGLNQKFASGGGSADDYSATITASFSVWDNLLTRVEYRHDELDLGPNGTQQDEISLNAVYSF